MLKNEKISSLQLSWLLIGFLLGDSTIISPVSGVMQDAWISFSIALIGGYILIGLYIYIAKLNPYKTLIDILKDSFGKYMGSLIGLFYIWYFIHIASLILRTFSEYMIVTNFHETPIVFLNIFWMILIAYALKKGIEVVGRVAELGLIIVPFTVTVITLLSIPLWKLHNILPVLEADWPTILRGSFGLLTFPFGEAIVFLMIFPHLNKQKNLLKSSYIAITFIGVSFIVIIIRNIFSLGAEVISRSTFTSHLLTSLIPDMVLEPIISITLILVGGVQISIFVYGATLGLTQVFELDDYKPFVVPVLIIVISLSNLIYDDLPDIGRIAKEIYPFYAIPYQFIIPLFILIISLIKSKTKKSKLKSSRY